MPLLLGMVLCRPARSNRQHHDESRGKQGATTSNCCSLEPHCGKIYSQTTVASHPLYFCSPDWCALRCKCKLLTAFARLEACLVPGTRCTAIDCLLASMTATLITRSCVTVFLINIKPHYCVCFRFGARCPCCKPCTLQPRARAFKTGRVWMPTQGPFPSSIPGSVIVNPQLPKSRHKAACNQHPGCCKQVLLEVEPQQLSSTSRQTHPKHLCRHKHSHVTQAEQGSQEPVNSSSSSSRRQHECFAARWKSAGWQGLCKLLLHICISISSGALASVSRYCRLAICSVESTQAAWS